MIYIIIGLIVWTLLGYVINVINGLLSEKQLLKYFENDKEQVRRDLTIRNMEGGFDDPSDFRLLMDAVLWPRTLFYAWRGQRRIIRDLESKED